MVDMVLVKILLLLVVNLWLKTVQHSQPQRDPLAGILMYSCMSFIMHSMGIPMFKALYLANKTNSITQCLGFSFLSELNPICTHYNM